jgi:hypothetical protein
MHPVTRAALAAALALIPSAALAGPIGWGYSATFSGDENPDQLYLGHHVRPDNWEPSGLRVGSIYGTPVVVSPNGAYPGSAHVRFGRLADGGVGVIWWEGEMPPTGGPSPTFTGCLTITDAASGATGAFLISGTGCITSDPMLYDFTLDLALGGDTVQERVIGGTRYHVRFGAETDASGTWLAADVSPAVATPEPGTLALAAFGLTSLRLLRRRGSSTSPASGQR